MPERPADAGPDHWFEPIAEHLGAAYLRYSFTKGTDQEVAFLVEALGLQPGMRVLDVGCGPGRHAHALARLGLAVHGIDISERFVALARATAPAGRPSSASTPAPCASTRSSTSPCRSARAPSGS
jgi:2-polyprenyl-3-methyl-5-hydroxy-6-metoxy-1,4-benzoquinol methylase